MSTMTARSRNRLSGLARAHWTRSASLVVVAERKQSTGGSDNEAQARPIPLCAALASGFHLCCLAVSCSYGTSLLYIRMASSAAGGKTPRLGGNFRGDVLSGERMTPSMVQRPVMLL